MATTPEARSQRESKVGAEAECVHDSLSVVGVAHF